VTKLPAVVEQHEEVTIPPERAAELLRSGEAQFVDVRRGYEWDAGRIEGAVHIEMNELSSRREEVARDRPVVFYCRGGNRSGMAAQAFAADGYNATHIDGGLSAWAEAGLPVAGELAAVRPAS
jgi:rhodanese-related sulfurtransferase